MVIQQMRKEMVDEKEGTNRLTVKVHMDDMKRVTIREQIYFYHNISFPVAIREQNYLYHQTTFFTLGIAFPSEYGQLRVTGGKEITRNEANGGLITKQPSSLSSSSFSLQSVQLRPVEGASGLGVLRVQRRAVRHTREQHAPLPRAALPRRGQVQLGLIQVQYREENALAMS